MKDTYVIFITEHDYVGLGLPIYHIEKTILETQVPVHDGAHIIYVNSRKTDSTKLGMLMHDFQCTNYEDMNYDILKERMKYFKNQKEGLSDMWELIEDWEIELADKITKKVTEEITKKVTDEVTKQVTDEVTKQVTDEVTKQVTDEVTKQVTDEVTKQVTDEVTKKVTDEVTKQVTDEVTKQVTDKVTKQVTDEVTRQVTAEVSESSNRKTVRLLKKIGLSEDTIADELGLTPDCVKQYLAE